MSRSAGNGNRSVSLGALAPAGVVATVVYVLFIGLPILALLVMAGQQEGFLAGLTGSLVLQALRLTVFTSVISLAIVIVVGTPFALLLARRGPASRLLRIIDTFVELPIVLPPVVAGVAMLMAFGRNGLLGPPPGVRWYLAALHHRGRHIRADFRGRALLHPRCSHRVRRR